MLGRMFQRLACVIVVAAGLAACSSSKSDGSISCYVGAQSICYEIAAPNAQQLQNLPVKCSSDSGDYETPSACPATGFIGKCTFAAPDGMETDRYYTGVDAAYQQSFCETVALGTWSAAF